MTFRNPVIKPQNAIRAAAVLVVIGPSLALLSPPATLPFNNFQALSKASSVVSAPPSPIAYNPNLYSVPAPSPFVSPIFPPTARVASSPPQVPAYNRALYFIPAAPFFQSDWSKPTALSRVPVPIPPRNPLLFSEVPFFQPVWSPARSVQSSQAFLAPNLNLLRAPFAQLNWPPASPIRASRSDSTPTPLALSSVSPTPFAQYIWPPTRPIQHAIAQPSPNLALTNVAPTAPFSQQIWPPAFRIRVALGDASTSIPLALFNLNPIPFALYDWSRPTKPAISVSYTPQNPIAINTPPPPASTLIQRTLTGVGL